jgi:RNA recognition motif-containing protein
MHIFIGNLSYAARAEEVQSLFEQFGEVSSVNIKKKSKGHAFVVMPDAEAGHRAIAALKGKSFMGRPIDISIRVFKR